MKKILFLLALLIHYQLSFAQLFDDFSDGDFTNNPTWVGDTPFFQINNGLLQSNGPEATASIYLSTANARLNATEWRFLADLRFEPSASNQLRVFLTSNQSDLKGELNGYYLEIGQSGADIIKVYRKTGTSNALIFSGSTQFTGNVKVNIRVRRDDAGNWQVWSDNSNGNGYILEGAFTDNTHISTSHFGFWCAFTSTRRDLFYFDNFYIGDFQEDTTPPVLLSADALLSNSLTLNFNEVLGSASVTRIAAYSVNNTIGQPSTVALDPLDNTRVNLTFNKNFAEGVNYTVSANEIADLAGNVAGNQTANFVYRNDLDTIIIIAANLVDVYFKQTPNTAPMGNANNYVINNGIGTATNAIRDADNPRLVHLVFPTNFKEAQNHTLTVSNQFNQSGQPMQVPPVSFIYDTRPPTVSGVVVVDSRRIRVRFNERLSQASATSLSNYTANNGLGNPVSTQMQAGDSSVMLQFANAFNNEVVNRLSVSNVRDFAGNPMTRTTNINFVYDTRPPFVSALTVLSADSLMIRFSEVVRKSVAENSANYIVNGPGNPISALRLPYDSTRVMLRFASPFPVSDNVQLSIVHAEDLNGNRNSIPIVQNFNTLQPSLAELVVLSANQLKLKFSKPIDQAFAANLGHYQVNSAMDPSTVQSISGDASALRLTFENSFSTSVLDTIRVLTVRDAAGNLNANTLSRTFVYDSRIAAIRILSANTLELEFREALLVSHAENRNNYALEGIGIPALAISNAQNRAIVRLIFSAALQVGNSYQLTIKNQRNQFDQRIPESVNLVSYDLVKPTITSISQQFTNQVDLIFSESVLERTAITLTNYSMNRSIGNPLSVEFNRNTPDRISLIFNPLSDRQTYELSVIGVEDLAGNQMDATVLSFVYEQPYVPGFNDLVFTEIMPNPKPDGVLPNREYVEIYNRSNRNINLKGLSYSDASSTTIIPSGVIEPGEYVILCQNAAVSQFQTYGKTIGLSSWPTLNVTGDLLTLTNQNGQIINQINYTNNWYKDLIKKDVGGWSIEMVDVENPCGDEANWTASESSIQGTPGAVNSVAQSNPDNFGPRLLKALGVNTTLVEIRFNEKIGPIDSEQIQISLNNGIGISSYSLSDDQLKLFLNVSPALQTGTEYRVNLSQIYDCSGNPIDSEYNSATFYLAEEGLRSDIVLNEILFNPRPGGVDFVEIYNKSQKYIDINGWYLSNHSRTERIISNETLIIAPGQYLAITADPAIVKADYPAAVSANLWKISTSMPAYPDREGTVILMNAQKDTFDLFAYNENMHFNLLSSKDGVSLERISAEQASAPNNWRSAASRTGNSPAFATPGYRNSQSANLTGANATISVEPRVFSPDNTGVQNFVSIFYNLEKPGMVATLKVYDMGGRLIKTLINNEVLPSDGFVRWDGDLDNGTIARTGYYMILLELFDNNGKKDIIKERVVVGGKF